MNAADVGAWSAMDALRRRAVENRSRAWIAGSSLSTPEVQSDLSRFRYAPSPMNAWRQGT